MRCAAGLCCQILPNAITHTKQQDEFVRLSEESPFNSYSDGPDRSIGVIATGIGYNYLQEAFAGACPHPVLKISQYPLPKRQLSQLLSECQQIMVIEEGMPMWNKRCAPLGDGGRTRGRLSGDLPRTGELNPRAVALAFGLPTPTLPPASPLVKMRPPRLCDAARINSYEALNEVLKSRPTSRIFGDIGCYTLGAAPYNAIHSCVDMGASISMLKGAADAGEPACHSGNRRFHFSHIPA